MTHQTTNRIEPTLAPHGSLRDTSDSLMAAINEYPQIAQAVAHVATLQATLAATEAALEAALEDTDRLTEALEGVTQEARQAGATASYQRDQADAVRKENHTLRTHVALLEDELVKALEAPPQAKPQAAQAAPDARLRKLRTVLARAIHPDAAPAGSIEQLVRQQVFQQLWPTIEALTQ